MLVAVLFRFHFKQLTAPDADSFKVQETSVIHKYIIQYYQSFD